MSLDKWLGTEYSYNILFYIPSAQYDFLENVFYTKWTAAKGIGLELPGCTLSDMEQLASFACMSATVDDKKLKRLRGKEGYI
jgi:hypothetical protein